MTTRWPLSATAQSRTARIEVAVHADRDDGGWYDFGFALGIDGFADGARQTRR